MFRGFGPRGCPGLTPGCGRLPNFSPPFSTVHCKIKANLATKPLKKSVCLVYFWLKYGCSAFSEFAKSGMYAQYDSSKSSHPYGTAKLLLKVQFYQKGTQVNITD